MAQQCGASAAPRAGALVHGGVLTEDQVLPFQWKATGVPTDLQASPLHEVPNNHA